MWELLQSVVELAPTIKTVIGLLVVLAALAAGVALKGNKVMPFIVGVLILIGVGMIALIFVDMDTPYVQITGVDVGKTNEQYPVTVQFRSRNVPEHHALYIDVSGSKEFDDLWKSVELQPAARDEGEAVVALKGSRSGTAHVRIRAFDTRKDQTDAVSATITFNLAESGQ